MYAIAGSGDTTLPSRLRFALPAGCHTIEGEAAADRAGACSPEMHDGHVGTGRGERLDRGQAVRQLSVGGTIRIRAQDPQDAHRLPFITKLTATTVPC